MNSAGIVLVVKEPKETKNLFGPISEVAGKCLALLERNEEGDCLCLFTGAAGTNLVDVHACDVAQVVTIPK